MYATALGSRGGVGATEAAGMERPGGDDAAGALAVSALAASHPLLARIRMDSERARIAARLV
jgi:hypothetical protein